MIVTVFLFINSILMINIIITVINLLFIHIVGLWYSRYFLTKQNIKRPYLMSFDSPLGVVSFLLDEQVRSPARNDKVHFIENYHSGVLDREQEADLCVVSLLLLVLGCFGEREKNLAELLFTWGRKKTWVLNGLTPVFWETINRKTKVLP